MAKILVLDGHSAAALAITRSAGRAGHWAAVGANRGLFAAAQLSRYCRSRLEYSVSTDNAEQFLHELLEFVRSSGIDLIIPVTDWTLGPISAHRETFANICRVALPPASASEIASDKFRTVEMAQSLGIPVPRTQLIDSISGLGALNDAAFPVVIKDRFSVQWIGNKATFGSVAYAYSPADLDSRVSARLKDTADVMVQEFVGGAGIGFSCFMVAGEVLLPFMWERLREVDPRGSASSARKSLLLEDEIVTRSGRLLAAMGFEGIAMVEYKRTADGRMVLMEINGRPWGSLALPIACGIDYPRYLIEWTLNGSRPPKSIRYRVNNVCRRLVGELTYLSNLRAGAPENWPGPFPGFWKSLAQIAVPWQPGMHYDDVWLSDIRPGAAGIAHWFRQRRKTA